MEAEDGLIKQHLIDPEICIRCNTCESRCPTGAISHQRVYVVDPKKCTFCMACVRPCPTGAIDQWVLVRQPYDVVEQLTWRQLPEPDMDLHAANATVEALDEEASRLLDTAHQGLGARAFPPASASRPIVNLWTRDNPAEAQVSGNLRVTDDAAVSDARHIILDFGEQHFPVLEGQTIGVLPPGKGPDGKRHAVRLYSVASARDGERPNTNNLAITVKRVVEPRANGEPFLGLASNWLCDLRINDTIPVIGPFGSTFLMPDDPDCNLLMICTGTGVAPFRGFIRRRRRTVPHARGKLVLFFGARSPHELPHFGPLQNANADLLQRELVFSRLPGQRKEYVQDRIRSRANDIASLLKEESTHIYICGLRGLEDGVERAFSEIGRRFGMDWLKFREELREQGRYHVETY